MLPYKNHKEKLDLITKAQLSLKENVEFFLDNINRNKSLNSYNFIFEESVNTADKIEEKIRSGTSGKCAGLVVAIKDVLSLKDKPLTCSSKILKSFESIYTATAVQKLIDEDAIIIGKTNCDEFAMGSSNENSAFGPVKNPIDTERVPGGSSGGSAAAVAAELCDVSLGTDTGGSIRQPASFVGVYGLKPTYGKISRYGLTAYASSFDSIGPFAKDIYDVALLTDIMSGRDKNDSTSVDDNSKSLLDNIDNDAKYTIGIPKAYFAEGVQKEVLGSLEELTKKLENAGHKIIDLPLAYSDYTISAYYILATAEASSNLARFDGVRFGKRGNDENTLEEVYTSTKTEGFGEEVKRRIMLGTYVLSSGYYDAYYKKAQQVRRLIKNDFDKAFESVDLILTPTAPTTAFKLGEKLDDPLKMYLSDIFTVPANLVGIPALSLPFGKDNNDLPIGMQFMANYFNENKLINIASFIKA